MSNRRTPTLVLGLMVATTLAGCDSFDDTYVLWRRYNGPGGNVWRIIQEYRTNVWKSHVYDNPLFL